MWNDLLPPDPRGDLRDSVALVSAWLADFGGRSMVDPPRIEWQSLAFGGGQRERRRGQP
jgi:hypothetical protein